jgi:hypothetical protein
MQLLLFVARGENDRENRWKDWENLSESEFWNQRMYGLGITTFRQSLKKILERNPDTIPALIEWVEDHTKIASNSPQSEATVT